MNPIEWTAVALLLLFLVLFALIAFDEPGDRDDSTDDDS